MKARQRGFTTIAAALTAFAVIALGSAGIAGAGEVTNPTATRCTDPDGRLFCVDLSTYSGITASEVRPDGDGKRYTWAKWTVFNNGGSTLTNPRVTVSLTDLCGTDDCKTGTPPNEIALVTSEFVLPSGGGGPCKYGATHATLVCTYANLTATGTSSSTSPTKVYFKTADVPATSTRIDAVTTVKERGNDANGNPDACLPGDPNCDTHKVSVTTLYEGIQSTADTFVLNNGTFYLSTNDKLSSFRFKSDNATPLQATFNANTALCDTPSPTCFGRELSVTATPETLGGSTAGYNDGPVVFYARLTDLPSGVNANSVVATHVYDPVTFTVSSNRLTPPTGMDARLDTVKVGPTIRYVVNARVTSTLNDFQLAATPGGPPLTITGSTVVGTPTRIIGDQSFERSNNGCVPTYPTSPPLPPVPSICAKKPQGLQALDVWVWDSSNGGIKFGGS